MESFYLGFVALHVILSLSLIVIVILQPGKGGDIGAAFGGGGGSTIFGPRGPGSIMQSITTGVAVAFMGTSIVLALYSNQALLSGTGDVMEEIERRAADRQREAQAEAEQEPGEVDVVPVTPAEATSPGEEGAAGGEADTR